MKIIGAVVRNHNSRTGILIDRGHKLVRAVFMHEGELVITKLTDEELRDLGYEAIEYPLKRAVRIYRKHAGGISKGARDALKQLVQGGQ